MGFKTIADREHWEKVIGYCCQGNVTVPFWPRPFSCKKSLQIVPPDI